MKQVVLWSVFLVIRFNPAVARRCLARFRSGQSCSSVCNYETGQWENYCALYHGPYTGPDSSTECIKEGVYLTWFNGEPIEEITNSNPASCQEKCKNNAQCDAWTFNTNNGWCALKTQNQVKVTENEGFVSGFKNCGGVPAYK